MLINIFMKFREDSWKCFLAIDRHDFVTVGQTYAGGGICLPQKGGWNGKRLN